MFKIRPYGHALLSTLVLCSILAICPARVIAGDVEVHLFYAEACPKCQQARPHLAGLASASPDIRLHEYDVWSNRRHFDLMAAVGKAVGSRSVTTPTLVVGDRVWFGFSPGIATEMEDAIRRCRDQGCPDLVGRLTGEDDKTASSSAPVVPQPARDQEIAVPWGTLETTSHSLLVLTVILALLDSFNPCAFFVLLFLLSLMVHARSRGFMLLIGGIFVLCSGLVYFLFMAAWLNLFLVVGQLRIITLAAGLIALAMAALNIKDYFFLHHGVTLSIPEQAKPKLFARMRGLLKQPGPLPLVGGTVVLALAANSYELLCTAGFPMIYTRLLTLRELSGFQHYAFLALYNLVYVVPLLAIVLAFTLTLGTHKLSEWQGRVLKLISGLMMFGLGLVLLVNPDLLGRVTFSTALLAAALGAALAIILATRHRYR